MPEKLNCRKQLKDLKCCILIPTYNNAQTLEQVILSILEYTDQVLIVNDGARDTTPQILEKFK